MNIRKALPTMKIPMAIIRKARVSGLKVRNEPTHPSKTPNKVYATSFAAKNNRMGSAVLESF